MRWIKKNGMFTFLIVIMSSIITYLIFEIVAEPVEKQHQVDGDKPVQETSILSFSVFEPEFFEVGVSWNYIDPNKEIVSSKLIINDVTELDVSEQSSIELFLTDSGIHTGNNKFEIIATLVDGTQLTKVNYLYVNEVQEFHVQTTYDGMKAILNVSYYQHNQKPVNAPTLTLNNTLSQPFSIQFVETEVVSSEGGYDLVQAKYAIDFSKVEVGTYTLDFTFHFYEYRISEDKSVTIQVVNIEEN